MDDIFWVAKEKIIEKKSQTWKKNVFFFNEWDISVWKFLCS